MDLEEKVTTFEDDEENSDDEAPDDWEAEEDEELEKAMREKVEAELREEFEKKLAEVKEEHESKLSKFRKKIEEERVLSEREREQANEEADLQMMEEMFANAEKDGLGDKDSEFMQTRLELFVPRTVQEFTQFALRLANTIKRVRKDRNFREFLKLLVEKVTSYYEGEDLKDLGSFVNVLANQKLKQEKQLVSKKKAKKRQKQQVRVERGVGVSLAEDEEEEEIEEDFDELEVEGDVHDEYEDDFM